MRYTILVHADQKDLVEAAISKLPSHYVRVWQIVDKNGVTYYSEPTEGATEVLQPVGQLATLAPVPVEGDVDNKLPPTHYILSGEFNDSQIRALKAAMRGTKLAKGMTWWEGGEPDEIRLTVEAI